MQLKVTGTGEVTVWSSEMSVTLGATGDKEEAAQRKEREGTNNNTSKRYPAIPTVALIALSYLPTLRWLPNGSHYKWTVVSRADSTQSVGVLSTSLTARVRPEVPQSAFGGVLSHLIKIPLNDLHSTMSCVVSEELAPTPLEAAQVMVAKALSLITLVALRVLVTLSVVMF